MNRKISIFCSTFVISGIIIYSAFDLGENKSPSIFYKDSSAKVKNNITTKNTSEKSRPSIETMSNEYILNTSSAEDDLHRLKLDINKSKIQLDDNVQKITTINYGPEDVLAKANSLLAELKNSGVNIIGTEYESPTNFGGKVLNYVTEKNEHTEMRLLEIEKRFENLVNN